MVEVVIESSVRQNKTAMANKIRIRKKVKRKKKTTIETKTTIKQEKYPHLSITSKIAPAAYNKVLNLLHRNVQSMVEWLCYTVTSPVSMCLTQDRSRYFQFSKIAAVKSFRKENREQSN